MQLATNNHSKSYQTIYTALPSENASSRATPSTITPPAYIPWYSAVKKQPVPLAQEVRLELGLDTDFTYRSEIAENSQFWEKLCVMALNEGVIDKHVIGSLVEARIGSLEQLDTAQFIADKVLVAYSERIKNCEKNIQSMLQSKGVQCDLAPELDAWRNDQSKTDWSYELTIHDEPYYGCGEYDEDNYGGLAIRIEHGAVVSALMFDMSIYTPALAKLFYKTVNVLSLLSFKANSLEFSDCWDELGGICDVFDNLKTPKSLIREIASAHYDEVLVQKLIDGDLKNALGFYYENDANLISQAARFYEATYLNDWYEPLSYFNGKSFGALVLQLQEELLLVRTNYLNENELVVKKTIAAVLDVVSEKAHNPFDLGAWESGSDAHMEMFSFVSFGTEIEDETLEIENSNRQSIGESGAIRLNLDKGEAGYKQVENIAIGNYCLLLLASIQ